MKGSETLLIHLGGLGDVCLSESTFYSLVSHFKKSVDVLGYKRFLELFGGYFERVHSVDERQWLWLFSDFPCDKRWKRTVLIGKDKSGEMRRRLNAVSTEPPWSIDMYPDEEKIHVEAYQLSQLHELGVEALEKQIEPRLADRVILYPEHSRGKRKWPYDHFLSLFDMLKARGIDGTLLEAPEVEHPVEDSVRFEQLKDTAAFFKDGGIFFPTTQASRTSQARAAWQPLPSFTTSIPRSGIHEGATSVSTATGRFRA